MEITPVPCHSLDSVLIPPVPLRSRYELKFRNVKRLKRKQQKTRKRYQERGFRVARYERFLKQKNGKNPANDLA